MFETIVWPTDGSELADRALPLVTELARVHDADLIVVGTHGRGAVATAMLGSVTKSLLRVAHCPVLAITPVRERVEALA